MRLFMAGAKRFVHGVKADKLMLPLIFTLRVEVLCAGHPTPTVGIKHFELLRVVDVSGRQR